MLAEFPDPLLPVGRQTFQSCQAHRDSASGGFRFRHGLKEIQRRQAIRGKVAIGSQTDHPVEGRSEQPHAIDRRPTPLQGQGGPAGGRQSPQQTTYAGQALLRVETVGDGHPHEVNPGGWRLASRCPAGCCRQCAWGADGSPRRWSNWRHARPAVGNQPHGTPSVASNPAPHGEIDQARTSTPLDCRATDPRNVWRQRAEDPGDGLPPW